MGLEIWVCVLRVGIYSVGTGSVGGSNALLGKGGITRALRVVNPVDSRVAVAGSADQGVGLRGTVGNRLAARV